VFGLAVSHGSGLFINLDPNINWFALNLEFIGNNVIDQDFSVLFWPIRKKKITSHIIL